MDAQTISVRDNIDAGRYENKVPYAYEKIPINDGMTIKQAREHEAEQKRLKQEQRDKHCMETARLTRLFRADLESEHGVSSHPKASKVWEMAWDSGHSGGLHEIANRYDEFVELIKE